MYFKLLLRRNFFKYILKQLKKEKNVLIFDLGGGMFDVSILWLLLVLLTLAVCFKLFFQHNMLQKSYI